MKILLVNIDEGQTSRSLLVNNLTKTRLALDNGIRDFHSAAQSRQPDNKLDGFNVMSNQHESGLLLLNQSSDMVQTKLDHIGGALIGNFLSLHLSFSNSLQALLLGLLVLRAVLVEESKNTEGSVLVQSVRELVESGRDQTTLQQHSALALDFNIFWPANESSEIATRSNGVTNTIVPWLRVEQGKVSVLLDLLYSFLAGLFDAKFFGPGFFLDWSSFLGWHCGEEEGKGKEERKK
mmetsp:Transcript_36132/g.49573  ORF Transcript_36132/g.49573 Transcript_36132/m.49573 type:complete len:236 (+) Transcript_36132:205-912(+)